MSVQLTPYFSLAELTVTNSGLDNSPDPAHRDALQHTAEFLERVRAEALRGNSVHVNSGYRSPAVNEAVGGVPNSAHAQGHAADITCAGFGTPYAVAMAIKAWIEAKSVAFDQIIFEENAWVHVSPQNSEHGQRRQLLTFDGKTYTDGIHPL